MTNAEKYKTAEERARAFDKFCIEHICNKCQLEVACRHTRGQFTWLDLEAEEEKIEDCPYCGCECCAEDDDGKHRVFCRADLSCRYSSGTYTTEHEAIAAHNLFARAAVNAKGENK